MWGLQFPGLDHLPDVRLPDYWIDRHEVTNRAYKQFVDERGYQRLELWREPFLRPDGRQLTFSAAMAMFRDATGQPGPATWEMGAYLPGQEDYPVAGVSWYEAAAYARWAGKSLPTLYHWNRAADPRLSAEVVPASNVGGKSLLPVGAAAGVTRGGTRDMAGNVKEWCLNAAGASRYIAGGAWNEPSYMFNEPAPSIALHADGHARIPLHQSGSTGGFLGCVDHSHRPSRTRSSQNEAGERSSVPELAHRVVLKRPRPVACKNPFCE